MLCTLHYFAKDYLFAELYSAVYLLHLWLDAWTRPQSWAALPSQRSGQKEQKEFECQREGEPKDKRNESHEGQSADTLRTLCQHCKHDPKCSACVIICSPKASSDSFCLSCVPTKSFVYVCVALSLSDSFHLFSSPALLLIPTCDSDWVRKHNQTIYFPARNTACLVFLYWLSGIVGWCTDMQTNKLFFPRRGFMLVAMTCSIICFYGLVSSTVSTSCIGLQSAHLLYGQVVLGLAFFASCAWSLQNWQFGNVMQCGMVMNGRHW